MWRRGTEEKTNFQEIVEFLNCASQHNHEIILGTDSQPFRSGTFLVTAIVILCDCKKYNCRFFYKQHEQRPIHHNLYERMYSEVDTTLSIANQLKEEVSKANISIHIDVSSDQTKNKTGRYSKSLVAIVKGFGYEKVEIKPNAWCASKLADKYTKRLPDRLKTPRHPL